MPISKTSKRGKSEKLKIETKEIPKLGIEIQENALKRYGFDLDNLAKSKRAIDARIADLAKRSSLDNAVNKVLKEVGLLHVFFKNKPELDKRVLKLIHYIYHNKKYAKTLRPWDESEYKDDYERLVKRQ